MGCALCRSCVSKKKRRTVESPFDLDLTTLHKNVTVMGYPSSGIEACYRNPYTDVVKYLDKKYGEHYLVVNLCSESERQYDPSVYFHGKCVHFPFPDHHPCQLEDIPRFVEVAMQFIQSDPSLKDGKMVAIHCKAGKGRSGLMACALLMAVNPLELGSAEKVMNFYGRGRTHDGKGLTIPSQRRYVQYYEQLRTLSGGVVPSVIPAIDLHAITISGLWSFVKSAEVVRIRVGRYDTKRVIQFSTDPATAQKIDGVIITEDKANDAVVIDLRSSQFGLLKSLEGDVRIDFLKAASGKAVWLASLSFHTLFVKAFYNHKEIDKLYKAKVAATTGFGLEYTKVDGRGMHDVNTTSGGAFEQSNHTFSDTSLQEVPVKGASGNASNNTNPDRESTSTNKNAVTNQASHTLVAKPVGPNIDTDDDAADDVELQPVDIGKKSSNGSSKNEPLEDPML